MATMVTIALLPVLHVPLVLADSLVYHTDFIGGPHYPLVYQTPAPLTHQWDSLPPAPAPLTYQWDSLPPTPTPNTNSDYSPYPTLDDQLADYHEVNHTFPANLR